MNIEVRNYNQNGYSITLPSLGTVYLPSFCQLIDITDDEQLVISITESWHTLDSRGYHLEKGFLYQYDGINFTNLGCSLEEYNSSDGQDDDDLHQIWPIANGLIKKDGELYVSVNLNGEFLGPFEDYRTFGNCKTTFAVKKVNGRWAFVNIGKKEIGEFRYPANVFNNISFSDGRLLVTNVNYKRGYVDENGNEAIECTFDDGCDFSCGYATVSLKENEWYIIDKDRKFLFNGKSFYGAWNLGFGFFLLQDSENINKRIVNIFTGKTLFDVKKCEYLGDYLYGLQEDDNRLKAILNVRTGEISDFKYDEFWHKYSNIPFAVGFLPFDTPSRDDCSADIIDSNGNVVGKSRYSILSKGIQLFLPSSIAIMRGFSKGEDAYFLTNWKTGELDNNKYDSWFISKNKKYVILNGKDCFKCLTIDNKEVGFPIQGHLVNLGINGLWVDSKYVPEDSDPEVVANEMLTSLVSDANATLKGKTNGNKVRKRVRTSLGHAHKEPFDIIL